MSNNHRHRWRIGRNTGNFNFRSVDHASNFHDLPAWRTFYRPFGFIPFDETDSGELTVSSGDPGMSTEGEPKLQVKHVDFLILENASNHRTSEFDIVQAADRVHKPVIRRGQPFDIAVTFNKPYDEKEYELKLVFEIGERPVPTKGTSVNVKLSDKDETSTEWTAKITSSSENTVCMNITSSPKCIVGRWSFGVDITQKSNKETYRFYHRDQVYVLFNPWCKDDATYFPNKRGDGPDNERLKEYVLNELGKIYTGSSGQIYGKPWNFGQFEGDVLDCIMQLLENNMQVESGWNPIIVVRKLSALVNSPDDSGILAGNWSDDYSGGTSPLEWAGSVKIIEEYYKTGTPVRYGQCWVFSGVLTTALRALGIAARSVTNFDSAHDNGGDTCIDIHFDCEGKNIEDLNCDSVWNFHVWNEAYMTRPDLPMGYGGWQVCDATPQETSHGIYCCGPTSVVAVKNGDIHCPFDGAFVFAEVNADRVYWRVDEEGNFEQVFVSPKSIGKKISTKKPECECGDLDFLFDDREDITLTYKYPEGSDAERAATYKANQQGCKTISKYECTASDVVFKLVATEDSSYGKPFDVILQVENNSNEKRIISGQISASSVYYTRVFGCLIKSTKVQDAIEAQSCKRIKMNVSFAEYNECLVQQCMVKLSVLCKVQETNQILTEQYSIQLAKPTLTIKAAKGAKVDKTFDTEISFVNPLPVPPTCCVLFIEGSGLLKPMTIKQPSVSPNGTFFARVQLTPAKPGLRNFIANFSSNELKGIDGVCRVEVAK